jgi:hypothetical protein
LAAAGWLLFGAAATVGVAWGCQLAFVDRGLSSVFAPGLGMTSGGREGPVVVAPWQVARPPGWSIPVVGNWWRSAWRDTFVSSRWVSGKDFMNAVGYETHLPQDGFPLWALWGRLDVTRGTGPDPWPAEIRGTGLWCPTASAAGTYDLALPLIPLWPGFAADTLLYAAAGFGSYRAFRAVHGWLRRRRGRCAACGYDRAGLPPSSPCAECGAAAPHAG